MKPLSSLGSRISRISNKTLALFSLMAISPFARADLPTVEDPTRGQGAGIFETMQNYAYDAGVFGGLLICTIAFIIVALNAVKVFHEVQDKKKSWTDFGAVVAIGVILVVVAIWLLTKAAEIL